MNENISNQSDKIDTGKAKANPPKKNSSSKAPWEPHFQISEKEPSCVYFKEERDTYFYDLQKISHYVFSMPGILEFTLSGRAHKILGKTSKCLFAALKDWHERKDK